MRLEIRFDHFRQLKRESGGMACIAAHRFDEFFHRQANGSDQSQSFRRGLDTLSPGEQLALAVLVRSPAGMDLRRNAPRARWAVNQLADRLSMRGALSPAEREKRTRFFERLTEWMARL